MTNNASFEKPFLKCLTKSQDCKKTECETIEECRDPLWSKNCYAMTRNTFSENQSNTSDQQYPHIWMAGCWAGGNECLRPLDVLTKLDKKVSYTLPPSLTNLSIQDSCIVYSNGNESNSYSIRNNVSFCCCNTSLCNKNIFITNERNPHEVHAESRNPINFNYTREIISNLSNESNDNGLNLKMVNASLMTGILTFSLIFLLVLLFSVLAFMYKKKFFFKNMASLPSVFFTNNRGDSGTELANGNINSNPIEPTNRSLNLPILPEVLLGNNSRQISPDDAQLIQPLLPQSQQSNFPSAVIAPNVVISDNPISNMSVFNSMNSSKMNRLPASKFNINSNFGETIEKTQDVISEDENHFSLIKASEINLLEKISHGQFSVVWKGESKTKSEPEIYYAIKIFSSNQKNAWFNEKEIYNKLVKSPNENILKYYGTDIHTSDKQEQQSQPHPAQFFFSASNFPINEFWLITEYHPCGSLHDFLKANYVSWPQMVNLCNCILEGLAYLHNEHIETRKSCAIAHRDLKSKNILVKNGGKSCCIGDLGLALKLSNANKLNSAEISTMVKYLINLCGSSDHVYLFH